MPAKWQSHRFGPAPQLDSRTRKIITREAHFSVSRFCSHMLRQGLGLRPTLVDR